MAFLDTKHQRAALIVFALGVGLLWALWPFATGIIGIPVLAVLFAPIHGWLVRQGLHSGVAAFVYDDERQKQRAINLLGKALDLINHFLVQLRSFGDHANFFLIRGVPFQF